jgi:hypothetical protein
MKIPLPDDIPFYPEDDFAGYTDLPDKIPIDANEFYHDFGRLTHDRTGEIVDNLTPYQQEFWNYQDSALAVKSQKIGLSTSTLMEDFQYTLLPHGRGKDVLIFGQNLAAAKQHVLDLKKMIRASEKYRAFMIDAKEEILFDEEQTKVYVIFVRNPTNPAFPSRIIGLGSSIPAAWSWKRIGRVHMSDVAKLNMVEEKQDEFFSTVFSRLAITEGIIKIETPPAGQQGFVYRLATKLQKLLREKKEAEFKAKWSGENLEQSMTKFRYFKYPAKLAVDANIISQSWLDQQLLLLGPLEYASKYGCKFVTTGNQWIDPKWIQRETWTTT